MRLAILGATGQIGRALAKAFAPDHEITLFARRGEAAIRFAEANGLRAEVRTFETVLHGSYDVIINAVGDGIPGRIRAEGLEILETTRQFDALCLAYLQKHPESHYIFLSTGAIYGANYEEALKPHPSLHIPLDHVDSRLYYPLAKLLAELRHRAMPSLRIADIRIFGFVSAEIDLESDFLVAQIMKACLNDQGIDVSSLDMPRDYIGTEDLVALIECFVASGGPNGAYDILSAAPTSKFRILESFASRYGLRFRISGARASGGACRLPGRLSDNRSAESLGYRPSATSLEATISVFETLRQGAASDRGRVGT